MLLLILAGLLREHGHKAPQGWAISAVVIVLIVLVRLVLMRRRRSIR